MSKKIWTKTSSDTQYIDSIDAFTVGKDIEFDALLAEYDIIGTKAHVKMLRKVGLISSEEEEALQGELDKMQIKVRQNSLTIDQGVEDIHSQIEFNLISALGDMGKKVHTGRSRNDQVLLAIKLYLRHELHEAAKLVSNLFDTLLRLADQHQTHLMPGYTHYQIAMPSSFGLYFSAFAEALSEDMEVMALALSVVSKNPLGTGAGYGSSFPLDRDFTTQELGLPLMNINAIYAQMTRGKAEKTVAIAVAALAATIGRLANDICLFTNQNFGFMSFPDAFTTGSSIMPHKKNPDVFELIRGKCSRLQAVPNEITLLMNNLMTGYNREYQLTKQIVFPALQELKNCIDILNFVIPHVEINENILKDNKYEYLFTVEKINELMLQGMNFRDAYRNVGASIENNTYRYEGEPLQHTHKGSIGNLALDEISARFNEVYSAFTGAGDN